jgi:hypothetical protein
MQKISTCPNGCTEESAGEGKAFDPGPLRTSIFQRWHPTIVFETFWKFATERQAIFYRRLGGQPSPWTTDQVLSTFKFTNVYRASDRVSQFLIREVIYKGDQSPREVFFRTILFKLFNKIDTWLLLTSSFGDLSSSIPLKKIDACLTKAMEAGLRIYSGAYIMPSGAGDLRMERKHGAHLLLLELMLKNEVAKKIVDCRRMQDAFNILRSYPMLGDFLAYQYVTDLNYSELTHFSESEFVVPGPGAKSGLRKCFRAADGSNEADIIRAVAECQENEFRARNLSFEYLATRRLQLIDCQNLFCEIDKYSRVVHPEIRTPSQRTKIKQRFAPRVERITYWYPPKWGINAAFNYGAQLALPA